MKEQTEMRIRPINGTLHRSGRVVRSLHRDLKPVSYCRVSDQVLRPRGIWLEFLPESSYKEAERVGPLLWIRPPQRSYQFVTGHGLVEVSGQMLCLLSCEPSGTVAGHVAPTRCPRAWRHGMRATDGLRSSPA